MSDPDLRPPVPLRPGTGTDAVALAERRARRAELGERAQAGRADAAEALAAELSVRVARLETEAERGEAGVVRFGRVHELETELQRAWQLAFAEEQRRAELEEELRVAVRAISDERDELQVALAAERERAEGYRARLRALEHEAARWTRPGEGIAPAAAAVPSPTAVPAAPAPAGLIARESALAARLGPGFAPVAPAPTPVSPPPELLEPERDLDPTAFDAARTRLRAAAPPEPAAREPEPEPVPVARAPWLSGAVRRLAEEDPAAAGAALLALAGAHHLAQPGPFAYRIELDGLEPQSLLVERDATRHVVGIEPDVVVTGDPAAFAHRALGTGRRRDRRKAKLKGRRGARHSVLAIGQGAFSVHDLLAAGAPLPAAVAYRLLAVAVPAAWTAAEPFAFAHDGVAVAAGAGGLRVLSDTPGLELRASIACPAERIPAFWLGDTEAAEIEGDAAVATVLQGWVEQLEAGAPGAPARPNPGA